MCILCAVSSTLRSHVVSQTTCNGGRQFLIGNGTVSISWDQARETCRVAGASLPRRFISSRGNDSGCFLNLMQPIATFLQKDINIWTGICSGTHRCSYLHSQHLNSSHNGVYEVYKTSASLFSFVMCEQGTATYFDLGVLDGILLQALFWYEFHIFLSNLCIRQSRVLMTVLARWNES